jgi:hypothetical protein
LIFLDSSASNRHPMGPDQEGGSVNDPSGAGKLRFLVCGCVAAVCFCVSHALALVMGMDRAAAISQIREACKNIALQFMKIHPALPHLGHEETFKDSLKAMHEMTVQLETIKKKIGKLEREDDSSLL